MKQSSQYLICQKLPKIDDVSTLEVSSSINKSVVALSLLSTFCFTSYTLHLPSYILFCLRFVISQSDRTLKNLPVSWKYNMFCLDFDFGFKKLEMVWEKLHFSNTLCWASQNSWYCLKSLSHQMMSMMCTPVKCWENSSTINKNKAM